jgi:hypothetical protein
MRNIFRMEGSMIAQCQKAIMCIAQILKEQNKIDIHRRALHAAHCHGESTDQSVVNACGAKFSGNEWNGGLKIHGVIECEWLEIGDMELSVIGWARGQDAGKRVGGGPRSVREKKTARLPKTTEKDQRSAGRS